MRLLIASMALLSLFSPGAVRAQEYTEPSLPETSLSVADPMLQGLGSGACEYDWSLGDDQACSLDF